MKAFRKLANLYREEVKTVRGLVELGEKKKRALIETDVGALDKVLAEESLLVTHFKSIERRRAGHLEAMAAANLIPEASPEPAVVIRSAPPGMKDVFRGLKAEIEQVVNELTGLNRLNRLLTDQSLDYAEEILGLLTKNPNEVKTYTGRGKVGEAKPLSFVDRIA